VPDIAPIGIFLMVKTMSSLFRYYDGLDRVPEPEFAKRRGKTVRGCRSERQRGVASPWVKDGRQIIYSWQKYLEHLEQNEQRPVRGKHGKQWLDARARGGA
jgi:hypothetical protein